MSVLLPPKDMPLLPSSRQRPYDCSPEDVAEQKMKEEYLRAKRQEKQNRVNQIRKAKRAAGREARLCRQAERVQRHRHRRALLIRFAILAFADTDRVYESNVAFLRYMESHIYRPEDKRSHVQPTDIKQFNDQYGIQAQIENMRALKVSHRAAWEQHRKMVSDELDRTTD